MPRSPYRRRTGLAARIARRLFRWRFRLLHARRYGNIDLARVHGLPLLVLPDVFHPEFFFATSCFLRYLDRLPITPGMRVLDVGTGSGALAVALARRGAHVTAVDISPRAVRCAHANVLLHDLEARVDVRQSDLFAAVPGERFDLIVFNPPFYDRPARNLVDRAWAAGTCSETTWRFLRAAPAHLRLGGMVLIMGSTEAPATASFPTAPGYAARIVAQRDLVGERLFLFALRPLGAALAGLGHRAEDRPYTSLAEQPCASS